MKPRFSHLLALAAASLLPHFGLNATDAPEIVDIAIDPATGMKMTGDWELVRNHCIACHSPQQFLRQKGTLSTWTQVMQWMQKSGGLAPLPAETEGKILAYLSQNYGPGEAYRRAPIPATLMPVNPYVSEARKQYEQSQK